MSEQTKSRKLNRARIADWAMMAVVVSLLLWAAFSTFQPSPLEQLEGEPAPAFKLKTRSGEVVGPGDHDGEVVLLDFWATWCEPCFEQMPILETVLQERQDLVMLRVNVDEPSADREAAIDSFLEEAGVDGDTLIDTGTVAAMYGVDTIPALVLIDPKGVVRWTSSGVTASERIVAEVDAASGGDGG